ncbi:hypothetical protein P7B02_04015 [Caulobacter segnis]|uniref:hypothetical protein n=1 Tax=Caulobacter segnis TaxID=88688 RepID=UPI00241087B4|nr:hypothetical protein [Caulobacter segnis]MDG2520698.1 hypothetical protein [Caulobacter segnis]
MRSSNKLMLGVLMTLGVLTAPAFAQAPAALSDNALRRQIIADGIAAYPAPCPCPYSIGPSGGRCGAKSAYSRGAVFAPRCFPEDISKAELTQKRQISYQR